MSATTKAPLAEAARAEAISGLGASFKRVMVSVRRLRGRDTQRPGTPSFAQYQLLFALADGDGLSTGELATAADLSPASVTQMLDAPRGGRTRGGARAAIATAASCSSR